MKIEVLAPPAADTLTLSTSIDKEGTYRLTGHRGGIDGLLLTIHNTGDIYFSKINATGLGLKVKVINNG